MAPPSLLVTGALGFVGQHVCSRARDGGWLVHSAPGDLAVEGVAEKAVREAAPQAVIHLAAARRSPQVDAGAALRRDVEMATRLLEAVASHAPDAVVLAAGSAAQYGAALARRLRETDPAVPLTAYGATKSVLERIFTAPPLVGGVRTIWCRAFNHAGPGQGLDAPLGSWVAQLAAAERQGGGVIRTGSLEPVRDVLDVRDVADAYLALAATEAAQGVINVCSGTPLPLRDLAEAVRSQARVSLRLELDPALRRAADPPFVVGDPGCLRSLTGWTPAIPLERTVRDMVAAARLQALPAPSLA